MSDEDLIRLFVEWRRDIDSDPFAHEAEWSGWTQASLESAR